MRLLLFIALIVSTAGSPALALATCASMGSRAAMTEMAMAPSDQTAKTGAMTPEDCDGMGADKSQTHDAGCAAACALVCPGFYSGPDQAAVQYPDFDLAQFMSPATDSGRATPSHLDPPPPRL